MKFLRLMFVGAGRVAQHYIKILKSGKVENFKVVAVVDTNSSAALSFSNQWEDCVSFMISPQLKVQPDSNCFTPKSSYDLHCPCLIFTH